MDIRSLAKYTVQVKREKIIIDPPPTHETVFSTGEEVYLTFPDHILPLVKN